MINRKNPVWDWVDLELVAPSVEISMVYASVENVFGRALYSQNHGFLRRPVAEALELAAKQFLAQGAVLVVLDAYRPLSITRVMWDLTPEESKMYVAHPSKGSRHNRGTAVDVSLKSQETGKWLEMPSEFDDFSERAHLDYEDMTDEARRNRTMLQSVMTQQGFVPLRIEWWHFDFPGWESQPVEDLSFTTLKRKTNPGKCGH